MIYVYMFSCRKGDSDAVILKPHGTKPKKKKKINFTVLLCSSFSTCASLITKLLEDTATCHSHSTPTLPPDINFTFYCLIISNVDYLMVNINYKKKKMNKYTLSSLILICEYWDYVLYVLKYDPSALIFGVPCTRVPNTKAEI